MLSLAFSGSDFRIKIPERSVVTVFCADKRLFCGIIGTILRQN